MNFLQSGYGSGKTLMLKEHCEQLARKNRECIFILCRGCGKDKTLLHMDLEDRWTKEEFNDKITIMSDEGLKVVL